MFKTLILGLVLLGVSLSFIGNVSAARRGDSLQPPPGAYPLERHDPTNTNGS